MRVDPLTRMMTGDKYKFNIFLRNRYVLIILNVRRKVNFEGELFGCTVLNGMYVGRKLRKKKLFYEECICFDCGFGQFDRGGDLLHINRRYG